MKHLILVNRAPCYGLVAKRSRKKKFLRGPATKGEKCSFSLSEAQPFSPPPPLSGQTTKKELFMRLPA